jgi:hypothetical protein
VSAKSNCWTADSSAHANTEHIHTFWWHAGLMVHANWCYPMSSKELQFQQGDTTALISNTCRNAHMYLGMTFDYNINGKE